MITPNHQIIISSTEYTILVKAYNKLIELQDFAVEEGEEEEKKTALLLHLKRLHEESSLHRP